MNRALEGVDQNFQRKSHEALLGFYLEACIIPMMIDDRMEMWA